VRRDVEARRIERNDLRRLDDRGTADALGERLRRALAAVGEGKLVAVDARVRETGGE
jgi:hypothetical protein